MGGELSQLPAGERGEGDLDRPLMYPLLLTVTNRWKRSQWHCTKCTNILVRINVLLEILTRLAHAWYKSASIPPFTTWICPLRALGNKSHPTFTYCTQNSVIAVLLSLSRFHKKYICLVVSNDLIRCSFMPFLHNGVYWVDLVLRGGLDLLAGVSSC